MDDFRKLGLGSVLPIAWILRMLWDKGLITKQDIVNAIAKDAKFNHPELEIDEEQEKVFESVAQCLIAYLKCDQNGLDSYAEKILTSNEKETN